MSGENGCSRAATGDQIMDSTDADTDNIPAYTYIYMHIPIKYTFWGMGPSQCGNDCPGFDRLAVSQKLRAKNYKNVLGFYNKIP